MLKWKYMGVTEGWRKTAQKEAKGGSYENAQGSTDRHFIPYLRTMICGSIEYYHVQWFRQCWITPVFNARWPYITDG